MLQSKLLVTALFAILSISSLSAQEDGKLLASDNPIIGTWIILDQNEKGATFINGEPHQIIRLEAGSEKSVIGLYFSNHGLAGPSYFVARKKGKQLSGVLTKTIIVVLKGSTISFSYKYLKKSDQIEFTTEGNTHLYERYKSK